MRPLTALGAVAVMVTLVTLILLRGDAPKAPVQVPEGALLMVNGAAYHRADFAAFRGRDDGFTNVEAARRAVDRYVDHLLLAQDDAPGAVEEVDGDAIDAAQVEAWYAAHRDRYVRGPRVCLAWWAGAHASDPERARDALAAIHVRAQLEQEPGQLARLLANPGPAVRGREVGPLDCEQPAPEGVPQPVLDTGCALAQGALSGVVDAADASYVVRRTASYPARYRSVSDAEAEIRLHLAREARSRRTEQRLARLRAQAEVGIAEPALQKLVSPLARAVSSGPPRPPGGGS